ncbi:MAG: exonuclease domain-containing protein [Patescibacteria group bacterium]|jgi:DNA polymerase-3 subunit epsilon
MYLIFDTETTGLPKNYRAPLSDFDNWPRLVQLAWELYDFDGEKWESVNYIIKPEGFIIPEEATKIHRISHEQALQEGVPLKEALAHFIQEVNSAEQVVGHNIEFDENIVGAELLRLQMDNPFLDAKKICTMKQGTMICRIDNGRGGFKWPNLSELHKTLFAEDFVDAHDALVDVQACAKCLFELKKRGQLRV